METHKIIDISKDDLGAFSAYTDDMHVTDIEWNGYEFLVTDLMKGKYKVKDHGITDHFIEVFSQMVANSMNMQFNQNNETIVADSTDFRIVMIHKSISRYGTIISLRRITALRRLSTKSIIDTDYCNEEILALLRNCVKAKFNITIGGAPGAGKSEFQKYLTQYIGNMERAVTIEEFAEMKFLELNPEKDCISFIVDNKFTYAEAIRKSVKLNAKWIFIAEVSGSEVKDLINAYTTGIKGSTTIHIDHVLGLPDRMIEMAENIKDEERMKDSIYEWVDVVLLVDRRPAKPGEEDNYDFETAPRYIDQVCFFSRENNINKCYMVMDKGVIKSKEIPEYIKQKMKRFGIEDPFICKEIYEEIKNEE